MATTACAPLMLPFDPASLPIEKRCEYLRVLWNADIDPFVFIGTARRLGYVLAARWDWDAGMPALAPVLTLLH
ncbi:hypothetical protein LJR230_000417 [Trinickia sp. LjRoot230]|uniref:hypothetical protein n=1 Tax=Trinickia sp. LjRoot230 TaxID=3342288 RepID=UPI003ECD1FEE